MTRARYFEVATDTLGRPVPAASVDVFQPGTTTAVSETIYAADSGSATLINPLSANTQGEIEFYLDFPKRVDLRWTRAGYTTESHPVDVGNAEHAHGHPAANTVATLGDSITGQQVHLEGFVGNPSSTFFFLGTRSHLAWANVLLRQRLQIVATGGISGNTTAQMLARVGADVIAYRPSWCVVMGGVNDINADVVAGDASSAGTIIYNLNAIFGALRAAGIGIVAGTILPSTVANTAPRKLAMHAVNVWLRGEARANKVVLVDWASLIADPATGNPATGYTYDGATHPNALGAAVLGQALARALDPLIPPVDTRVSSNADPGNILANGMFTGSTAGLASSWFTGAYSGGAPVVTPSKVARTDVFGAPGEEWQQLALTSGDLRLYQNVDAVYVEGDRYLAEVEFETDPGASAMQFLTLELIAQTTGGAATLQYAHGLYHDPVDTWPTSELPRAGVLRTPSFALPATTARLQFKMHIQGVLVARFARAAIRKVQVLS